MAITQLLAGGSCVLLIMVIPISICSVMYGQLKTRNGWEQTTCYGCTKTTYKNACLSYYVGSTECKVATSNPNVTRTVTLTYPYVNPCLEDMSKTEVLAWGSTISGNITCYVKDDDGYNIKISSAGWLAGLIIAVIVAAGAVVVIVLGSMQ